VDLCTEKKSSSCRFLEKIVHRLSVKAAYSPAGMILLFYLASCQQLPVMTGPGSSERRLSGKWTIHYLRSAESILKSRGEAPDADRLRNAGIHLKEKFYGEFEFTGGGRWSLLYRVDGREKTGHGTFEIQENQNGRLVLVVREDAAGPESAPPAESLLIEFLDTDLILISKNDGGGLPPLVFQREPENRL
jgi:hypothetical protein